VVLTDYRFSICMFTYIIEMCCFLHLGIGPTCNHIAAALFRCCNKIGLSKLCTLCKVALS